MTHLNLHCIVHTCLQQNLVLGTPLSGSGLACQFVSAGLGVMTNMCRAAVCKGSVGMPRLITASPQSRAGHVVPSLQGYS